MTVTVRFFAAARDAAGTAEMHVAAVPTGLCVRRVLDLATMHAPRTDGQLAEVLARCSYLVDGLRAGLDTPVPAGGGTLDVLPPFAGG